LGVFQAISALVDGLQGGTADSAYLALLGNLQRFLEADSALSQAESQGRRADEPAEQVRPCISKCGHSARSEALGLHVLNHAGPVQTLQLDAAQACVALERGRAEAAERDAAALQAETAQHAAHAGKCEQWRRAAADAAELAERTVASLAECRASLAQARVSDSQ